MLFQFDKFLLDTDRRELRGGNGVVVHVEPQVFDLLLHLAQNANRVVTKDELIEHVWKGRAVDVTTRVSGKAAATQRNVRAEGAPPGLALPDKPSIAVLPFQNLSDDPAQDYFADGMVEDIITGLSRIKWLFVIARNSTFTYKGQPVDVKRVGRELGVRYVLEGSVRKAGERIRISAQLVEAESSVHLWAQRYDGQLDDIFALQDEITLSVVGAIEPSLRDAEIERVKRKRPDNLDAYDLVLRALPHVYVAMPEEAAKAVPLLEQALGLEADYAGAHGLLAWCYQFLFIRAGVKEANRIAAIRHARAAVTHGRDDATALALGAFVIGLVEHDRTAAREAFEQALALASSRVPILAWRPVRRSLLSLQELMRQIRHHRMSDQVGEINAALRGHYAYCGVGGNIRALFKVYRAVERYWHRMLRTAAGPENTSPGRPSTRSNADTPLLRPKLRLPFRETQALAVL